MSPRSVLNQVKQRYPDLCKLPTAQLKLVEKAILYAKNLGEDSDVLSDKEHKALLAEIGPKEGLTPGKRLRAYRLRQELNQEQLAKNSGISQANNSAMERDKRTIGLNVAKKLGKVLKFNYKKIL